MVNTDGKADKKRTQKVCETFCRKINEPNLLKLNTKDIKLLASKGYEYLDVKWCYAKVGKNISIMQSQKKDFYIHFTKETYQRGNPFDANCGVCVRYFKTMEEVFKTIDLLEKYQII